MQLIGLIVMIIGSGGIVASTILEIRTKAPIYALMMKIFPWILGVGAILFSLVK